MLEKIKLNLLIGTGLIGLVFIGTLFVVNSVPNFTQKILHISSDYITFITLIGGVIVPFVPFFYRKTAKLWRVLLASSSFCMLIMYILYASGFETVKEVVSMVGFNIATSFRSIVLIWFFILIARGLHDFNKDRL